MDTITLPLTLLQFVHMLNDDKISYSQVAMMVSCVN